MWWSNKTNFRPLLAVFVTQLAERMILTPRDPGSNPGISPFYGKSVKDENKESPEIAIF